MNEVPGVEATIVCVYLGCDLVLQHADFFCASMSSYWFWTEKHEKQFLRRSYSAVYGQLVAAIDFFDSCQKFQKFRIPGFINS